jgi:hypothetical protein
MKISELLVESRVLAEGARIVHPEDLVFSEGIAGAKRAIASLSNMASGKELTTIKWDGFPALVFGRDVDGQLMVVDKHMFDKKDGSGRVKSPEQFRQYDAARGADRADLYAKIDLIWNALESIIPAGFKGFYMGDLLYAGRPQPQGEWFVFKPNTVTYRVKAKSAIGQKIAGSVAGIAVHTFISGIGQPDQPLKGLGGLPDSGPIWFVTGEMPVPKVAMDQSAVQRANAVVAKYDGAVSEFLNKLNELKAKGLLGNISTYITSKIATGSFDHMLDGFYKYLPSKLSPAAATKLLGNGDGWLYKEGRPGIEGLFAIWVEIYNLKLNIKQQIDAQANAGDIQAFTGKDQGHEGYVVGGGEEKMKLIDRLGFSRANFAKNG